MNEFKVSATADKLLETAADVVYEIVTNELLTEVAIKLVKTSNIEFILEGSIQYLKTLLVDFKDAEVEEYKDTIRSIIVSIALNKEPQQQDSFFAAATSGLCYLSSCVFLDAAAVLGFTATVSKFTDIVKSIPNHIFMMIAISSIKKASKKITVTWPLFLTDEEIKANIFNKTTCKEQSEIYAMMRTNNA
jgi:hypothetical protein